MMRTMFGPRITTVFASRWRAIWFAGSILLFAYMSVPEADAPADNGQAAAERGADGLTDKSGDPKKQERLARAKAEAGGFTIDVTTADKGWHLQNNSAPLWFRLQGRTYADIFDPAVFTVGKDGKRYYFLDPSWGLRGVYWGGQAIARLWGTPASQPYDLMLIDWVLPVLSGIPDGTWFGCEITASSRGCLTARMRGGGAKLSHLAMCFTVPRSTARAFTR